MGLMISLLECGSDELFQVLYMKRHDLPFMIITKNVTGRGAMRIRLGVNFINFVLARGISLVSYND